MRGPHLGGLDAKGAARAALVVGTLVGTILIGCGAVSSRTLIAVGAVVPFLALQDTLRYVAFALNSPRSAAVADSSWAFGAAVLLLLVNRFAWAAPHIVLLWAAVGIASTAALLHLVWPPEGASSATAWLRASWPISRNYLPDHLMVLAISTVPLLLVGWFGGSDELGGMRFAVSLVGPINIMYLAVANFLTPRLANRQGRSLRTCLAITVAAIAAFAGWGLLVVAIPERIGSRLVGNTWSAGRVWFPSMTVAQAATGLWVGAVIGLKAQGRADRLVRARVTTLAPQLALPVAGYLLADRWGFGAGSAVSGIIVAVVLWREFVSRGPGTSRASVPVNTEGFR